MSKWEYYPEYANLPVLPYGPDLMVCATDGWFFWSKTESRCYVLLKQVEIINNNVEVFEDLRLTYNEKTAPLSYEFHSGKKGKLYKVIPDEYHNSDDTTYLTCTGNVCIYYPDICEFIVFSDNTWNQVWLWTQDLEKIA